MNSRHLTKLCLLTGLLLPVFNSNAQVLAPGLTGFQRLTLLGNSDSYVSTPFARPASATAVVQSVAGNVITIKGVNPLQPGQFVNQGGPQDDTYYVLITSGAGAGSTFPVTANETSTITVNLDGDVLNAAPDDRLAIIPYWTLGSVFPGGLGIHVSPSASDLRTELILPDLNAPALNAGVPRVFHCLNGDWMEAGQPGVVRNSQVLLPDSLFIVRHNIAASTEMLANGAVVTTKLRSPLGVNPGSKRDNYLALQRPTTFTLASSGLVTSGAFAPSASLLVPTDVLYVYDNTVARKSKSASATYFYQGGGWRKVGSGSTSFDNASIFTPGTGFIIRKAAGSTSPIWVNLPNY